MADSKVGILITAKDQASSTIKNVKGNLTDLGTSAGSVGSLSNAFSALGKSAAVAAAAMAAIKVGEAVVELAQLGAQAQRIETSFQTLAQQAGISSDQLLSSLQKASNGTIANTELMLTANRALALGVADSSSELSQLMEVAIARGRALGLSAQQAFSDLVTGIGRMSPLILDNLGIITGGEKVFEDYARSIGKSSDALSDTERKQALVNKVIAESRDLVKANAEAGDDAAASFERASAAFQNIKTDLGQLFGPAIAAFAEKLAVAVDVTAEAVRNFGDANIQSLGRAEDNVVALQNRYEQLKSQINTTDFSQPANIPIRLQEQGITTEAEATRLLAVYYDDLNAAKSTYLDALVHLHPAQIQAAESMNRTSVEAEALLPALQAGAEKMAQQQNAAANLGGSLAVLAGHYNQVAAAQSQISASLTPLAGQVAVAAGSEEAIKFLNQATIELSKQKQQWEEAGFSATEITVKTYEYMDALKSSAEETYLFGQSAVKSNKLAADSVKALSAEYDNIKSKVGGVLTDALGDIGGVDLDSILPREDAVGEDARRLADIAVHGFDSPWAAYFREKFPEIFDQLASSGDPKTAAAQILREFQSGLRPELLDKGRAKELVKRAIIGEQNIKALTDEIAKEVADELGVSLQEAQAAASRALGGNKAGVNDGQEKKISIIPTIDKSQLSGQALELSAKVTTVIYADSIVRHLDYSATVTELTLAEAIKFPILAAELGIEKIVIPENVKPPTPIITGGMTIDAVALRNDVAIPNIELTGNVVFVPPDTSAITETVLQLTATVTAMQLGDNVALPIVAAELAISRIVLSPGVTPPTPSITGGLTIDSILLPASVELPEVTLAASAAISFTNREEIEATPLQLTATIDTIKEIEIAAHINLQPLNATAITETPLQLSASVTTIELSTNAVIPILHSNLVLDSVVITNETAIPAPPIVGKMTIDLVELLPDTVLPTVNLTANTTITPLDVSAIEQTPINLTANVALPDLTSPIAITVIPPDLRPLEDAKPVLDATVNIDWTSASVDTAPSEIVNQLALRIPAIIDWQQTETESAKEGLTNSLAIPIVPSVLIEGIDTETPRLYFEEQLKPSIVPTIDYFSISFDELAAGGIYIASGISAGIATFNLGDAIVTELNKAQAALRENGIASGRTWGSGFANGSSEFITSIVSTVVALALSQIAKQGSRTGAQ